MLEYYKAFRFESFILFTDEVTDEELKELEIGTISFANTYNVKNGIRAENEKFYLNEWVQYYVIGITGSELSNNDYFYSGQYNRNNSGVLCFKNFIGTVRFRDQVFNVDSHKIKTRDFNEMVSDVDKRINDTVSLVFKSNSIAQGNYLKAGFREYDYYMYMRIFQIMKENGIVPFCKYIRKHSNFKFERTVETKLVNLIKDISPESIIDVVSGESNFSKTNISSTTIFNNILPIEMNEYQTINSVDTNENQFVKFFLEYSIRLLNHFRNSLIRSNQDKEGVVDISLIHEVRSMQEELITELSQPFYLRISRMNTMNSSSTVLTRKYGYKELLKAYLCLKQTPISIFDSTSLIELFQNKSVDKLYEYICLFRLIDILSDIYGKENIGDARITTKGTTLYSVGISEDVGGVEFIFNETENLPKVTLMFQHSFSRSNKTYNSVSVNFRPDFTIQLESKDKIQYYHFDSKFRVGYKESSKNEDIAKMHSYRDAILSTSGAYILYPGEVREIYGDTLSNPYGVVGAFPLNFDKTYDEELEKMLTFVLSQFKNLYSNNF